MVNNNVAAVLLAVVSSCVIISVANSSSTHSNNNDQWCVAACYPGGEFMSTYGANVNCDACAPPSPPPPPPPHPPPSTSSGLFTFALHTFSSCGQEGPDGPTLAQCTNAYSGASSWVADTSYFTVNAGYQIWTVPASGRYKIKAVGAVPPKQTYSSAYQLVGGKAAIIEASFNLTKGQKLKMLVGQAPVSDKFSGGGGGTFVAIDGANHPLIVAGGGGSYRTGYAAKTPPGLSHMDANYNSTAGKSCVNGGTTYTGCNSALTGGTNGGGGGSASGGGGGAGFSGDAVTYSSRIPAKSFQNGGAGGKFTYSGNQFGGFGGGGHGGWGGAGGGGGYSGGAGANNNLFPQGGGGGSYIHSTSTGGNSRGLTAAVTGHGNVTITRN